MRVSQGVCSKLQQRKRTNVAVGVAALLMLIMAACTTDDAPAAQTPGDPPDEAADDAEAPPQEPMDVNVLYFSSAALAPFFVAMERGYFEEAGLRVQADSGFATEALPLMGAGQLDVLVAGFAAGLFNGIDAGLGIKIVGSTLVIPGEGADGSGIYVPVDSPIQSPSELAGKTVAAIGGTTSGSAYFVGTVLREHDLTLNDVELVTLSSQGDTAAAFASGVIDAAYNTAPTSTNLVEQGIARLLAAPPEGKNAAGIVFSESFTSSPAAQPFFDALVRGLHDVDTPEKFYQPEILVIVAEWTGVEVDLIEASPAPGYAPDFRPAVEALAEMQEIFIEAGVLEYEQPIPTEVYIDERFYENRANQ